MKRDREQAVEASAGIRRPGVQERAAVAGFVLAVMLSGAMTGGCSRSFWRKPAILWTRHDLRSDLRTALEDPSADARRSAIQRVADTSYVHDALAIETFDLIARTDDSGAVRCAALDALGRSGDPKAFETFQSIIDGSTPKRQTRRAGVDVRGAAWRGLLACVEGGWAGSFGDGKQAAGGAPEGAKQAGRAKQAGAAKQASRAAGGEARGAAGADATAAWVCARACRAMGKESSRDVRIIAARLHRNCRTPEALASLVDGLSDPDFALVFECHRSLMRLTGQSLPCQPEPWQTFLASTDDPFHNAPPRGSTASRTRRWWWVPDYFSAKQ